MAQKSNPSARSGNQRHVVLVGKKGSGKTSIFHQLVEDVPTHSIGQGAVIGTCKLGQGGSIVLIDTKDKELNGASPNSKNNALTREELLHMHSIIRRVDIVLYVTDIKNFDRETYLKHREQMERRKIPYLLVFNRCDESYAGDIARLKTEFHEAVFISKRQSGSISLLRARLSQMIQTIEKNEAPIVPVGLVKPGDYVLVLTAPKGDRPICNEEALINQLVERGARCVLADEAEVQQVLEELPRVDLVIAYARSFQKIRDFVPEEIPLTSYSLLFGLQAGELETFVEGARAIDNLTAESRVLIAEGCPNRTIHRDTGWVKIPRALRKRAGEQLQIDYSFEPDLPEEIQNYDLVIHCSGCSMTQRAVQARAAICEDAGIPIANYGTVLAYLAGILDRCTKVLLPDAK
jgi:[FeFe] hydrogenase H-cluster maturation GTPase HydF